MKNVNLAVAGVTFGLFMTEAMLHYNYGAKKEAHGADKGTFVFPPAKDMVKIGATVAAFSIVNGIIVNKLLNQGA
jgi:plastocyanin